MHFRKHFDLEGRHAVLSPSKHHWMRYDEDKFDRVFLSKEDARRGSELHALAAMLIRLRVRLPDTPQTLNMYVNDCIGFRLKPEQHLRYSDNAFGTADAIDFRSEINKLIIADLKNGVEPAHIAQLEGYAALFCLEYNYKPFDIEIELRIYQNDECQIFAADPDSIFHIMEKIRLFDLRIAYLREEAGIQ